MEISRTPDKTKRSLFKRLMKAVAYLFLIVVLIMGGLVSLLFIYEDDVKAAVISELNKHLKAEVKVDPKDIDLTIIKTFPDCSIQFSNLLMYEALKIKQRDTLLFAKQLNLHFSIRDLWNKQYNIKAIGVKDAVIKLRVLKNGQNNYTFWEEKKETTGTDAPLNFALELVRLKNCRFLYTDKTIELNTAFQVRALDLKGLFHADDYELNTNGKLWIDRIVQNSTTFLKDKNFELALQLDVKGANYQFKKTRLNLNQLAFELNGGFVYKDSLRRLDVNFAAPHLDIVSILSLLPEKFKKDINDYKSDGSFYANGHFGYSPETDFSLESNFGIRNAKITYMPNSTTAEEVNLDGQLHFGKRVSSLDLKNIHLKLNRDEINGSCSLSDFDNLRVNTSVSANLDLANLQAFLAIDTLNTLKGNLKLDAKIAGRLEDLKHQTFSDKVSVELEAAVSNLEAGFKNDDRVFAVENCIITARERDIEVRDLRLKRGSSDISLNGKLPGFFNYLADEKAPLIISGQLNSNYLKLEDFMVKYTSSGGEKPLIPANIRFLLNAEIARFTYAKFEATEVNGEIEIKNQKAIITDMKLKAMGGGALIDAFADNSGHRLNFVLQSKLQNINISTLFQQLNNFGQSTLQDKNIKGFASAEIEFSGSWNNQLETDLKSIRAMCNLRIERGELIDFKPLLSLSRFVDIRELQRIQFANLQSTIRIENSMIAFPKTSINNSALNIDLWGSHSFNNEIDYHIHLFINDLMAKKRKQNDEEFGPVEDDPDHRYSAFIRMTGTVDKPVPKYDHEGFKQKVKEDVRKEKQTIKQILKEEAGLFKKDSTVKKPKRTETHFELEKPGNNPPKKALEPKKKEEDEDF